MRLTSVLGRIYQRTPGGLRRLAGRASSALPPAVEERLAAWAAHRPYVAPPPPVDVPDARVRLYVAPANYAGQGYAWARAVERHLDGVGARNMAPLGGFGFQADQHVPGHVYRTSRSWQRAERAAVEKFTHVIVEAQLPLFPRLSRGGPAAAGARLRAAGGSVATLSHGSEVRLPSAHARREEHSPFRGAYGDAAVLESVATSNLARLRELRDRGVPAFVSTPDLLLDVPWATWLPVCVDTSTWAVEAAPMVRRVPVVVHAPSRGSLKGTDLVEPVLRELDESGMIEYRQAKGLDRAGMQELYRRADVVLDQFALGSYGVAACEAMAAGRVVVSHVSDQVRDEVRRSTGTDLPVVQAEAGSLRAVLLRLLDDRDAARDAASRGPELVRRLHDGRAAAAALAPFLGVDPPS